MSWSVTVLLLTLIMQFGMYGIYAIPLHLFSALSLFIVGLFVLLLVYVKKQVTRLTFVRTDEPVQLIVHVHVSTGILPLLCIDHR